jgi:hypothetical protein
MLRVAILTAEQRLNTRRCQLFETFLGGHRDRRPDSLGCLEPAGL